MANIFMRRALFVRIGNDILALQQTLAPTRALSNFSFLWRTKRHIVALKWLSLITITLIHDLIIFANK